MKKIWILILLLLVLIVTSYVYRDYLLQRLIHIAKESSNPAYPIIKDEDIESPALRLFLVSFLNEGDGVSHRRDIGIQEYSDEERAEIFAELERLGRTSTRTDGRTRRALNYEGRDFACILGDWRENAEYYWFCGYEPRIPTLFDD